MKKIVLCLLVAIVMSNCQVSVTKVNAENTMRNIACNNYDCVNYEKVTIEGMELGIFSSTRFDAMAPFVINFTKEKLEIELLRKQLEK